jgi:tRNA wybutosine-synthesizing protein 4
LNVVQRKAEIIRNVPELQDLVGQIYETEIGGSVAIVSSRYRLIPVDLIDINALECQLLRAGIDYSLPSLFLSECVLTYLAPQSSSLVIEWTAKSFHNCTFITYEQVYPSDGFGRVMMHHFQSRSTPLQGIMSYPSPTDQEQRYKSLGFDVSYALDMNYFYHKILDVSERKRVLWLEPFDEFEEWHLKCSHYVLIMSVKNMDLTLPVPQMAHPCLKSLPDGTETWDSFKAAVCVASNPLQRSFQVIELEFSLLFLSCPKIWACICHIW